MLEFDYLNEDYVLVDLYKGRWGAYFFEGLTAVVDKECGRCDGTNK